MKIGFFLLPLAILGTTVASAQVVRPMDFTMDTAFVVGNTTLPAGQYEIRPSDDPNLLEVRGIKGSPSVFFDIEPIDSLTPFKQSEVVFNKYGNHLVLKSIEVGGSTIGATTVTTNLEKRHRKAFGKPTRVSRPASMK